MTTGDAHDADAPGDAREAGAAGDAGTGGEGAADVPSAGAKWLLRPATLADAEEIAFAELELFPDEAWNVFQLAEEIDHPWRRYVVALGEGELLGYAGIMLAGETADLHTIGTRRPGVGIGRALLRWCEHAAREAGALSMLLEVREDNERARAFYTAAGYTEVGRREGYYRIRGRRIDALVMRRELPVPSAP